MALYGGSVPDRCPTIQNSYTSYPRNSSDRGVSLLKTHQPSPLNEDITLQVLRILKENPRNSQRELAGALGTAESVFGRLTTVSTP